MKMSKTHRLKKEAREEGPPPPLSRILRVDDIEDGEECSIEASKAEREAIASLLDLTALDSMRFTGSFHFAGEGGLLLKGSLTAKLTQICVVSLEPFESELAVPVEIEFWPSARIDALERTADEASSHGILDWPEPILDGKIELGPVLYETLATALDPYPRREGVSFTWTEAPEAPEAPEKADSPFSALSRLKDR
jgi:uncharacterized metal-binding protein YceD (DUF177 family)